MKHSVAAALVSTALAANSALAGGMAEPIMEPVMEPAMIEEDTAAASRAGIIVPIFALIMFGLAASNGNDAAVAPSDARLKTDILRVGSAANGLPLYQFRYIGQSTLYEGVMAQDVLAHAPEAVVTLPGGFLAVDYAKLGLELKIIH